MYCGPPMSIDSFERELRQRGDVIRETKSFGYCLEAMATFRDGYLGDMYHKRPNITATVRYLQESQLWQIWAAGIMFDDKNIDSALVLWADEMRRRLP